METTFTAAVRFRISYQMMVCQSEGKLSLPNSASMGDKRSTSIGNVVASYVRETRHHSCASACIFHCQCQLRYDLRQVLPLLMMVSKYIITKAGTTAINSCKGTYWRWPASRDVMIIRFPVASLCGVCWSSEESLLYCCSLLLLCLGTALSR